MDKNRRKVASRILNLTLEIIFLVTGKEYTEKKTEYATSSSRGHGSGGWRKKQSPRTKASSNSLLNDRSNTKKILKLTTKIIELLSEEDEWEYLEEHKDLYKDIIMDAQQPVALPEGFSREDKPEICPSPRHLLDFPTNGSRNQRRPKRSSTPLYSHDFSLDESRNQDKPEFCLSPISSQDCAEEQQTPEDKDLTDIKVEVIVKEESFVWDDQEFKEEEIPIAISPGICNKDSDGRFRTSRDSGAMFSDFIKYNFGDHSPIRSAAHPHCSVQPYVAFKRTPGGGECGKKYKHKSKGSIRRRNARPYACTECPKCFTRKSDLFAHLRTHTERQFTCLECSKSFKRKSYLVQHQRIHTGENLFPCQECGKRFTQKLALVEHMRTHTGEKPFPCLECGKYFTTKSNLFKHQKIHSRDRCNLNIKIVD